MPLEYDKYDDSRNDELDDKYGVPEMYAINYTVDKVTNDDQYKDTNDDQSEASDEFDKCDANEKEDTDNKSGTLEKCDKKITPLGKTPLRINLVFQTCLTEMVKAQIMKLSINLELQNHFIKMTAVKLIITKIQLGIQKDLRKKKRH